MKHFTFLTNWSSRKSVQVMTRTKPGNDHNLSRTCVRLDSLSILSRQSDLRTYVGRIAAILVLVLTVGVGNAWGAQVGPTTISISSGWTNKSGATYCGGYGKNAGWYVSDYNITALSTVLSNAGNSNFSLTIRVKGLVNQGGSGGYVNSLSVVLLNSSGSTVGDPQTITNLPNGTSSSAAQWKSFSFTPTSAVTGYKIYGGKNCAVFQTEYTLTYDNAPSCDKTVTLNYDGDASGLHGSFVLKAGSASGSTIAEGGTTENCGSGTTSVVVVPTPDEHYHVASVSATNKTGTISGPDGDGNYTISYTQGSNISSTVTVGFEEDTKYTVTWTANGSQHAQTQVYSGEKPTFPSAPISPDATSNTFYGWATSTWSGSLDDISAKTVYTYGAAMPTVTGNVEYQAVWAKPTTTYQILGYGDILTDGNYVIDAYYNSTDYAMGNSIVSYKIAGTSVTPSGDDDEYLISPAAALIWKISHIDGTYVSLYNANAATNHYLGLTSSGLTLESSPTTNGQFNPVLTEEEGYATTVAFQSKSQSGKELQNYKSSFQSYTSQSSDIYLYRQVLEKYATTFCSALGTINGSVNLTYP